MREYKTGDYYILRGVCCKELESNYHVLIGRIENIKQTYLNNEGKSWVDNKYFLFMEAYSDEPDRGHSVNDTTLIVNHSYIRAYEEKPILNIRPVCIDESD